MPTLAKVTLPTLFKMKQDNEKIAVLTAYDASFARLLDNEGVDVILVGDSLGNVIQGRASTLPVTVADMVYHTKNVKRGIDRALLITDLPFMSYATVDKALLTAEKCLRAGAAMIKMEGGVFLADTIQKLAENGIPTCCHLGLQPQSVNLLGGYRVQGRELGAAEKIMQDAKALQAAGAKMLVLECVPYPLAEAVSKTLTIPVIGIGAGPYCDGQVLVLYDMLGLGNEVLPQFVKNFMQEQPSLAQAIHAYVQAVKQQQFPTLQQSFN